MNVAGLIPFTTIDFPENLAAVVFFQGCPLRCPFCHNPNLQDFNANGAMEWSQVVSFLQERKKRLDGVVFSGGEPLMQPDIFSLVSEIKEIGFKVAIHTSGIYPERMKQILPLTDWVGLDVKAPKSKYNILSGRANMDSKVYETLSHLLDAKVNFEARTTLDPRYLSVEDIYVLADELLKAGVETYALQKYRTFDGDKNPPAQFEIDKFFENEALISFLKSSFKHLILR